MIRDDDDPWVFGYGSLVWRPAFPFVERRVGWVRGWSRRFWQASTDHRGVPGAPGRVVTLVSAPEACCWGMAYRVAPDAAPDVLARLDHREKGGYRRVDVDVTLPEGGALPGAVMYLAGADNPDYAGSASMGEIAAQVRRSRGPSGSNLEYVLELAGALRTMGAPESEDEHLYALVARLKGEPDD